MSVEDSAAEWETVIRRLKRHPLTFPSEGAGPLDLGREAVRRLLPHREPMEFIDGITAVDLAAGMIEASSWIPVDAPVFKGHFPGDPVYPGICQIETMGQAALCLAQFLRLGRVEAAPGIPPLPGLFTRIRDAGFIRKILPGTLLVVRAQVLAMDDFLGLMAGQILVEGHICSHAVLEVAFPLN